MQPHPLEDLPALHEATNRLVRSLEALTDADVARPSLLAGWTIGHVATHLARNAEGIERLVGWAVSGVPTPMYDSLEAREADIAAGAGRAAAEIRDDVRDSADRVQLALERLARAGDPALDRLVIFGPPRPGVSPDTAARTIPFRRLQEVEIHHLDLGLPSFRAQDWPPAFVERMLLFIHGRSGAVDVVGPPEDVLLWRLGRGTPDTVTRIDGSSPGAAPPW